MSPVVEVVILAVASALLGVILYGLPMTRIAVGPNSFIARRPLVMALLAFVVGAVVNLAVQAIFGDHLFEADDLALDLAGIPVILASGTYTAGRLARRRAVRNAPPPDTLTSHGEPRG